MPPAATKTKLAFFSIKVTVKVTSSLTLVSFESVSLIEKIDMYVKVMDKIKAFSMIGKASYKESTREI